MQVLAEPFGTVFFFRPASWVYHINLRKFRESILEHIIVFIVLSAIPGQISPSITAVNIAAVLGHNVGVWVIGPQALQQVFQHIYIAVVELPDIVMRVLAAIARERLCRCKLIQINTVAAIRLYAEFCRIQQILSPQGVRGAVHGEMFRTIGFPVHLALLVPHGHLLANQLMEVRFQIKYARVDIQRGHTAMIADIFQPAPEFHGAAEFHIGIILWIKGVKARAVPACNKHMPCAPCLACLKHSRDVFEGMLHLTGTLKVVALVQGIFVL